MCRRRPIPSYGVATSPNLLLDERNAAREPREVLVGDKFLLVGTLPATAYHHAHLPAAISLPPDQVAQLAPKLMPDKSAEIVVYCASPT